MDITRAASEGFKVWLSLGGVLLLVFWHQLPKLNARYALLVLTLVAGLNYARFGPKIIAEHIDSYDVIHYYMGAKYFDELGYYDLYPALILADSEHPRGPFNRKMRSYRAQDPEKGYLGHRPLREGIAQGKKVREEKFSSARWQEFTGDFYHFQRDYNMTPGYWKTMMGDRGFNGTPVWVLLAEPLVNTIPAQFAKLFCLFDIVWLIVALAVIRWAYDDWLPVLWASFFLFVTYSLRWPIPGQAFLRYDWVGTLLIAMGLLRKNRAFLGGMFAALPALLRFFPVVWMFGPFCQGVLNLFWPKEIKQRKKSTRLSGQVRRSPRLNKALLLVGAGFISAFVVLEGGALLKYGTDAIRTHAENIAEHTKPEELSSRRMGFALAYTYDGSLRPKTISEEQKQRVLDSSHERLALSLLLLLGLGLGLRNLRKDEAFAVGYIPFFMLATGSYYYAVARITLIIFHAQDLKLLRNRVCLAVLIGLELFSNFAETTYPNHRVYLVGRLSWGLTFYSVLLVGWLLYENYQSWHRRAAIKTSSRPKRKRIRAAGA